MVTLLVEAAYAWQITALRTGSKLKRLKTYAVICASRSLPHAAEQHAVTKPTLPSCVAALQQHLLLIT